MILEERYLFREADLARCKISGKSPSKRRHLFVRCDTCSKEWLAIKSSYMTSKAYHANNSLNKDLCKGCRAKLDYIEGTRKKPRDEINFSNTLKESRLRKRKDPLYHSAGYIRTWTKDINHPRIHFNKRDNNPQGGRVYEHILVMEKNLGRYLTKEERVHHINGVKSDNRIDNLYLVKDDKHHQVIHSKLETFMFKLIEIGKISFDKETETFYADVS